LRFCNRPWDTIEEHDRALVELWNAVVQPDDVVYVIGDFAHKMHPRRMRAVFDQLRGEKNLIVGNHDKAPTLQLPWSSISERLTATVDGQRIVLDHYPGRSWSGSNRGSIQLFGHTHGRLLDLWNACDVGVDRWSYMPVDLPSIMARLAEIPRPSYDADDELEDEPSGPKL
jgi:calcineurin-like phosphoesterase family protein